ncbi:Crp/Fnr family transcriptional regulator [Maribacter sp.]
MTSCDFQIAKQFNFLRSMTEVERAELTKTSSPRHLQKGEVLFMEAEQLQKLFCIREGACKFSKIDEKGKEHITKLLGKGELMGRRSLISKKGAMVTATAITDTTICSVDKLPVLRCLMKNTDFCMDVIKGFVEYTDEEAKRKGLFDNHQSITKRLAGLLIYLDEKFGTERDGTLKLFLKREDMANLIGTSSEYVISILSRFKRGGLLDLERGKIRLLDKKGLEKMC